MRTIFVATLLLLLHGIGCGSAGSAGLREPSVREYALAIHGGAGVIDIPDLDVEAYRSSLGAALEEGRDILARGGTSLAAVEAVVRRLEDDPLFNAGKGAVYNADGGHELDASIMDGRNLACGAVAGVKTVRHPITLARRVMTDTRHVLLAGDGADRFAAESGLEIVSQEYFHTDRRRAAWERAKQREADARDRGTVGAVALDRHGNLAAATSTGGLTNKRFGRVGDSPIVGAGTYADNRSCAVSCTGTGEEFIRHGVAREIAARLRYRRGSLSEATRHVVHDVLKEGDGGVIAVSRRGEISLEFNTPGMFRGAADSSGRFEVAIWRDEDGGGGR